MPWESHTFNCSVNYYYNFFYFFFSVFKTGICYFFFYYTQKCGWQVAQLCGHRPTRCTYMLEESDSKVLTFLSFLIVRWKGSFIPYSGKKYMDLYMMNCELLATCSALGYLEGDAYHKEPDCLGEYLFLSNVCCNAFVVTMIFRSQ